MLKWQYVDEIFYWSRYSKSTFTWGNTLSSQRVKEDYFLFYRQ